MLMSNLFWMVLSYPFKVLLTCLGTVVLTAIVYLKSLFRAKECLPRLYFKDSGLAQHVLARCQSLRRPIRLPFWMQNAHVQTLMGWGSRGYGVEFHREYIEMKDDGVVATDWEHGSTYLPKSRPIIVVVPDFTGDAISVAQICQEVTSRGYRAVVFNRRGHGRSYLTTVNLQSYGDPSDLRCVVQYLCQKYPKAPLAAVGVGSGSDLLFSYLGEYGSSSYLAAASCISPSYDTEDTFLNQIPKLYELAYLMHSKKIIGRHTRDFSDAVELHAAMNSWRFKDFDKEVHCKLSGYNDIEEYWEENSPLRDVDDIAVPVLCINSLDDPISVKENIPFDLFKSCPNFFLVTTERGGHCGFLEGALRPSWTTKPALDFIAAMLEFSTGEQTECVRDNSIQRSNSDVTHYR